MEAGHRSAGPDAPRRSIRGGIAGQIRPLRHDLDLAAAELGLVEQHRRVDRVRHRELDVGEPLRMAGVLVRENRDPVDGAAAFEVGLEFLRCAAVVDLGTKQAINRVDQSKSELHCQRRSTVRPIRLSRRR